MNLYIVIDQCTEQESFMDNNTYVFSNLQKAKRKYKELVRAQRQNAIKHPELPGECWYEISLEKVKVNNLSRQKLIIAILENPLGGPWVLYRETINKWEEFPTTEAENKNHL